MRNEEGKSNDKTIPQALYNGGHADTLTSIIDQIRRDHSRRTKQQPSLTTKRILNREEDINAFFCYYLGKQQTREARTEELARSEGGTAATRGISPPSHIFLQHISTTVLPAQQDTRTKTHTHCTPHLIFPTYARPRHLGHFHHDSRQRQCPETLCLLFVLGCDCGM